MTPIPVRQPAVNTAFGFITNQIQKGAWQPGEQVPSIKELAQQAGVSFGTMQKALARHKSSGLLTGSKGGKFRISGSGAIVGLSPSPQAWQLKRSLLEKDIFSGVYADRKELPTIKELQARYGTCFATMRKILRSMANDGIIGLRNKKYESTKSPGGPTSQRVVFITYRYPYRIQSVTRTALNHGQNQVLGMFERECINRGVKLDIVEIDFYNPIETRRLISSQVITRDALGYILDLWWNPQSFYQTFVDLLSQLDRLKRVVTILDESGDLVFPLQFTTNPRIQVFRIEARRAGGRMAGFLLGMGHRSIAFISAQHINRYSQDRLEGVIEQYTKAGYANAVNRVVTDRIGLDLLHILAVSGLDDALLRKVISVDRTESQTEDQFNNLAAFRERKTAPVFDTESSNRIRRNLAILADLDARNVDKGYFDRLCIAALTEAGSYLNEIALAPLFEQALALRDVTAWVCVTDTTALSAIKYLRHHGKSVPHDISVTGFDNEPFEAVEQRLTTYDFNAQGFVNGILNFIVRPPKHRGLYRHAAIEIDGIIVARGTTAEAI